MGLKLPQATSTSGCRLGWIAYEGVNSARRTRLTIRPIVYLRKPIARKVVVAVCCFIVALEFMAQ